MSQAILRGNPNWERLYQLWVSEKKPGTVLDRDGAMFRVICNTDEDIQFHPQGSGIDGMYNTRSTSTIIK